MKKWMILATVLGLVVVSSQVQASMLSPGGSVTVGGSFVDSLVPGGTVLASITSEAGVPGMGTGTSLAAHLTTEVLQESSGTLDFVYQVSNDTSSTTDIHRVTTKAFNGFSTDVGFSSTVPSGSIFTSVTAPVLASADVSTDGSTVGFQISPETSTGIGAGKSSYILFIRTNATSYTSGYTFAIDGGTLSFNSFAPAVPEPASLVLAGSGILGLAGLFLIRRRKGLPLGA